MTDWLCLHSHNLTLVCIECMYYSFNDDTIYCSGSLLGQVSLRLQSKTESLRPTTSAVTKKSVLTFVLDQTLSQTKVSAKVDLSHCASISSSLLRLLLCSTGYFSSKQSRSLADVFHKILCECERLALCCLAITARLCSLVDYDCCRVTAENVS